MDERVFNWGGFDQIVKGIVSLEEYAREEGLVRPQKAAIKAAIARLQALVEN